jgi:hypothetical protein
VPAFAAPTEVIAGNHSRVTRVTGVTAACRLDLGRLI